MNGVRVLPATTPLGLVYKRFGDHIESREYIVFPRRNSGREVEEGSEVWSLMGKANGEGL